MSKKDKVKINFINESSKDVTGSGCMITYNSKKYLLELGLCQGKGTLEEEYKTNLQTAKNLNIKDLEAVIVSHCNIDHIGLLPALSDKGYKGKIYGTKETLAFANPLLEDCAYILKGNKEKLAKRGIRVENVYRESSVWEITQQFQEIDCYEWTHVNEEFSFAVYPTPHLTGAVMILVAIKTKHSGTKTILYTGDLGSHLNYARRYEFMRSTLPAIRNVNLIISECTYFHNMLMYPNEHEEIYDYDNMMTKIKETLGNGGNVIIPAFAMQRSQQLMIDLYNEFYDKDDFKYDIVVDGRLTNRINRTFSRVLQGWELKLWESVMHWKNFIYIDEYPATMYFMAKKEPKIVICSSGMCLNGHSPLWVEHSLHNSKDLIVQVGYAPEGSVLWHLKQGTEKFNWNKKTWIPRCNFYNSNCYASHIYCDELTDLLLKSFDTRKIIFHHGSEKAKENAVRYVEEAKNHICGHDIEIIATSKENKVFYI